MEELGRTRSQRQARRMLEQMGIAGHWTASKRANDAVVWSRGNEEVAIDKIDDQTLVIVKYRKGERSDTKSN